MKRAGYCGLLLLILVLSIPVAGATREFISCPDATDLLQVGVCPDADALARARDEACGASGRAAGRKEQTCSAKAAFVQQRNKALWESRDGTFNGMVACGRGGSGLDARSVRIDTSVHGSGTRVHCTYELGPGNSVVFTYRTPARCSRVGPAECRRGGECRVECAADESYPLR